MNTKPIFILLLAMGLAFMAGAQERSFGTLPLVPKPGFSWRQGAGEKIQDSPEYQRALGVYERLVQARGDNRYSPPDFVMRRSANQVATMNYKLNEVTLEEKAYQVCAEFGEDTDAALAYLLGHELTHYYEKHGWRRGFVSNHKDMAIGSRLDSIIDMVANETEADYLGGFLAYSAGYGLFGRGDEVIKKLYEAYGLPPELPGYPSLSDRQALTRRAAERMAALVEVFDMANLLTALGKYPEAFEYYRYILMEYQSRETYNNVGVAAVLSALQYYSEQELKYRFPLQIDLESSAAKDGAATDREKLVKQAILHFDAAISLDPDYAPAYLNKACAFAILGDAVRARFYAETEAKAAATRGKYTKTLTDIDILLGILADREGRPAEAAVAFERAVAAGSALAAHNLAILDPEKAATPPSDPTTIGARERINGKTIAAIKSTVNRESGLPISPSVTFKQNPISERQASKVFMSEDSRTNDDLLLHITDVGYTGKTARDITVGDQRAAVVKAYGIPVRTLETPRGQIMVYEYIVFIIGADGGVERWANY